jgi:hypothetical protein
MRDLPTGTALLELARDVLLNDLLPLLPPESRLEARLVANSMAIAEREATAGEMPAQELVRDLQGFYPGTTFTHPATRAGSPVSRNAGEGAEHSEAGEGGADALRRLASDLRAGAFESSPERVRRARAILWRLTITKLRLANPRFLAANGLG